MTRHASVNKKDDAPRAFLLRIVLKDTDTEYLIKVVHVKHDSNIGSVWLFTTTNKQTKVYQQNYRKAYQIGHVQPKESHAYGIYTLSY